MTLAYFEAFTDQWHGVVNIGKSGLVSYKVKGIQNANSGGWLREEKGVRTMKLKADARSDTEGRRNKNLNKKGER